MGTPGSKKRLQLILSVPAPICNFSHINDPVSTQMSVIDHLGWKIFTYKTTWFSVILWRSGKQLSLINILISLCLVQTASQSVSASIMTDYPRVTSALEIRTSLTADQGNHTLAGRCGCSGEHQDAHTSEQWRMLCRWADVILRWLFSALITLTHRRRSRRSRPSSPGRRRTATQTGCTGRSHTGTETAHILFGNLWGRKRRRQWLVTVSLVMNDFP